MGWGVKLKAPKIKVSAPKIIKRAIPKNIGKALATAGNIAATAGTAGMLGTDGKSGILQGGNGIKPVLSAAGKLANSASLAATGGLVSADGHSGIAQGGKPLDAFGKAYTGGMYTGASKDAGRIVNGAPSEAQLGDVNGVDMSKYKSGGQQATASNGLQSVEGGTNAMGIERPDHYLMRNANNTLNPAFAENVGSSTQALRNYGNTFGSDVDARAKVGMGSAYDKMTSQAMGRGDLEQTALMRGQLNNRLGADLSDANRQSMSNLSQTQSQMAMRGGVSGGSMERMGRMNNRDNLMANQGIRSQNRDQNLQLSIENANTRNNMLRDVGQVQQNNINSNANAFTNNQNRQLDALTKAGIVEQDVQKSNVNAIRGDLQDQNSAASKFYGDDMAALGASKQAAAQRAAGNAGGGSRCFITTACVDVMGMKDDCWVLETARGFRDTYMTTDAEKAFELAEYYQAAPALLEKINNSGNKDKFLKSVFWKFIIPFCALVKQNKLDEARVKYKEMMSTVSSLLKEKE